MEASPRMTSREQAAKASGRAWGLVLSVCMCCRQIVQQGPAGEVASALHAVRDVCKHVCVERRWNRILHAQQLHLFWHDRACAAGSSGPHPLQLSGLPQELVTTLGGAYAGSDRKSSRICAQPHPGDSLPNALGKPFLATWVQKIRCMQELHPGTAGLGMRACHDHPRALRCLVPPPACMQAQPAAPREGAAATAARAPAGSGRR